MKKAAPKRSALDRYIDAEKKRDEYQRLADAYNAQMFRIVEEVFDTKLYPLPGVRAPTMSDR